MSFSLFILCFKIKLQLTIWLSHFFFPPEVTINYRHGLPVITLTLPTRSERCRFTVKPTVTTVGAFLQDVQREDKGIERAEVFATGTYTSVIPQNEYVPFQTDCTSLLKHRSAVLHQVASLLLWGSSWMLLGFIGVSDLISEYSWKGW